MAKRDTLFTVAGITIHRGSDSNNTQAEKTKVRYGTDFIRVIKMLNSPKKIRDDTLGICLSPVRVDIVELPQPMLKVDALKYLATLPEFSSPEDQALIADELDKRPTRSNDVSVVMKYASSKKENSKEVDHLQTQVEI